MTLPEARVVSDGLSSIFTESTKSTFVRKRPEAAIHSEPMKWLLSNELQSLIAITNSV